MITLRRLAAAQYKGLVAVDLTLPERGSILIEGRNEAGKSTLFDAIYFALYGVPLVGEIGQAIHYGADELAVQLTLDVSGAELSVRRRARQTAKTLRTEAELEIRYGDEVEVVRGSQAVTQRLQQELGGLTAEALLNSCLVAQKQLGRLESLSRGSREEALTILLNLAKLSEVQQRLRPRPDDDAALRRAQARVDLARIRKELAAVACQRATLERQQRIHAVREGIEALHGLQQALDEARQDARTQEQRLVALSQRLQELKRLKEAHGKWDRVAEAARRCGAAEQDVALAEQDVAQARAAAAALPGAVERARRYHAARDQAQALSDRQAQLRELATRDEQVRSRRAEREHLAERGAKLERELETLMRQRHELQRQIAQLAPLEGELQASRQRLEALNRLTEALGKLADEQRQLEELQARAVARVEAEERAAAAVAELRAARDVLDGLEAQRRAAEQRQRLAQARDLLSKWQRCRQALDEAAAARRLLADLALAVSGVEHVAVPDGTAAGTAGLLLSLIVDHPLTAALVLRLRLWSGGAELVEARPAAPDEARGLQAGRLPAIGAPDGAALRAELQAIAQALRALGETVPTSATAAAGRLAELEQELQAAAPAFDEEAYVQARARVAAAETRLADAQAALSKLPDARAVALETAAVQERITALEKRCGTLAESCGLSAADAGVLQRAIPLAVKEEQERSNRLNKQLGRKEGLSQQLSELNRNYQERARDLADVRDNLAKDSDERLAREEQEITSARACLQAEADTLQASIKETLADDPASSGELPADAVALRTLVQQWADEANRRVAVLEDQARSLPECEARLRTAVDRLAGLRRDLDEALAGAQAADEAAPSPGREQDAPHALPAPAVATERLEALAREIERLNEPAVLTEQAEAQRAAGAAEDRARRAIQEARRVAARLVEILAALGHALPSDDGELGGEPGRLAECILQHCPEAAEDLPSRDETESRLRALDQEAGRLEQARQQALVLLGESAAEEETDLEMAEQDLRALELDLAARRRAQDIIVATRQRMISKVLPDTLANMCVLLPHLTAGRYRHASLSEDYRLQVWDERKRDFVEKSLFSGGTQDQFSLALRLGFALAALPRELGTSPGFLFLDEPLSSFDHDRTAALVELLTHGQIATHFQQVFLISHSQAFDPALFTYHIVMEGGQVASSTLPGGARTISLP